MSLRKRDIMERSQTFYKRHSASELESVKGWPINKSVNFKKTAASGGEFRGNITRSCRKQGFIGCISRTCFMEHFLGNGLGPKRT